MNCLKDFLSGFEDAFRLNENDFKFFVTFADSVHVYDSYFSGFRFGLHARSLKENKSKQENL